jgi:voltage-gated sodium channel
MNQLSSVRRLVESERFNAFILVAIIINSLLIGVQTYDDAPAFVHYIQLVTLFIFFFEIIIRWLARESSRVYLTDLWNYFDIAIFAFGVVPEIIAIFDPAAESDQNSIWATLRILRIVQLTRSIRAVDELRMLVAVLLKSIRSLSYIAVLFLLIMYIYAVVGVTLFKNREYAKSEHLQLTVSNPDPYGDVGEAFFTLFRIMTGEDWTDLRYNLLNNEYTNKDGSTTPNVSNTVVTIFHVSWMITAAYLLMNLVVGAIVNNFQLVLDARRAQEEEKKKLKQGNSSPPKTA